ncbi:MAG: hypothetical protein FD130_871 [Halothiobacillaceae bacterium]|nr:MAG: hypothetical protein FD130_871 [Halothiobacillaceae bacterium]
MDPAAPAAPITVEAGSDIVTGAFGVSKAIKAFQSGSYNSATKTVTGLHTHAVIYAKTDGKLYRVSGLKSGSLTPVQLSSENGADQLCVGATHGADTFTDFASPDNSQYLYALPGSDDTCETGDDIWKMVRLGMSASDAPVVAKRPVSVQGDFNTGAIAGWLVHDAGALKKCDANFAACGRKRFTKPRSMAAPWRWCWRWKPTTLVFRWA